MNMTQLGAAAVAVTLIATAGSIVAVLSEHFIYAGVIGLVWLVAVLSIAVAAVTREMLEHDAQLRK